MLAIDLGTGESSFFSHSDGVEPGAAFDVFVAPDDGSAWIVSSEYSAIVQLDLETGFAGIVNR